MTLHRHVPTVKLLILKSTLYFVFGLFVFAVLVLLI